MSEWKTYKLGELGTLARGKSKHRPRDASFLYGGQYPFIQTGDIKAANHRINKHTQTYSEEGLKQSKLWPTGTICITIAANIADTAILSYPACFPDSVIGFIADETKCNVDFIEYLLQYTKRSIQSHSIGSVQENINLGTFENFTIDVPNLPTQSQIASILSSLDDKIELNLQMNQTLEAMAQAIFKEWFVNFNFPGFDGVLVDGLPKGWKETTINQVVDLIIDHRGKTPTKLGGEWVDAGIPALSAKNVKDGKLVNLNDVGFVNEELHNKWMKEMLQPSDILLTSEGPLGEVAILITNTKYCLSQRLFAIRTNDSCKSSYLYFYLRSEKGKKNVSKRATGSTVVGIRQSELRNVEVLLPSNKIQLVFEDVIKPILSKTDENYNEINLLTQIRDTLLPKLMTGKIEIKA